MLLKASKAGRQVYDVGKVQRRAGKVKYWIEQGWSSARQGKEGKEGKGNLVACWCVLSRLSETGSLYTAGAGWSGSRSRSRSGAALFFVLAVAAR